MEQDNRSEWEPIDGGWDAWDAVPRDGPAVFVIDTQQLKAEGRVHGRWIDLRDEPRVIRGQLSELVGQRCRSDGWAIVDQVGLGPRMAPEQVSVEELAGLAEQLVRESLG